MSRMHRLLIGCFLLPVSLGAQEMNCSEGRYTDHLFDDVTVIRDIPYGEALTMGGRTQTLLLDFYEPLGDPQEERPLLIIAHGGAFVSGDRTQTHEFCSDFAKRGYVCANITYRLLDKLVLDSIGLFETALMATNDMRAAVRYFKEDAAEQNAFKISPDHIFVAGVSAGAIMANHVAFLDSLDQLPEYVRVIIEKHGGFEGNSSENTQYTSEVQGVLNYSGALTRSHWIDADDPPVYSAHDDGDPTVPCNYNKTSLLIFPVYLYGSCAMKTVADQMNVLNELFLVSNSTEHVSYFFDDGTKNTVLDESAEFLSSILCQGSTGFPERFAGHSSEISIFPNPFSQVVTLRSEAAISEIRVSGISGQSYLHLDHFSGRSLDLGNLPQGIYLIHVRTEQGSTVLKAVKQ